jgi:hypothetical protein
MTDYRHQRLMDHVAQTAVRRSRGHRLQDLLAKPWRRHTATSLPCHEA